MMKSWLIDTTYPLTKDDLATRLLRDGIPYNYLEEITSTEFSVVATKENAIKMRQASYIQDVWLDPEPELMEA